MLINMLWRYNRWDCIDIMEIYHDTSLHRVSGRINQGLILYRMLVMIRRSPQTLAAKNQRLHEIGTGICRLKKFGLWQVVGNRVCGDILIFVIPYYQLLSLYSVKFSRALPLCFRGFLLD